MTHEEGTHLKEKEIILAVVDETDLPEPLREHLSKCGLCRTEKEQLEDELSWLGRTAESLAPLPKERVKLIAEGASIIDRFRTRHRRSLLATGMAAALIIAVLLWKTFFPISPEDRYAQRPPEFGGEEGLMAEILFLVENPLPRIYLDLSGESNPVINEEFIEFVIPDIQNETFLQERTKEKNYA